MLFIIQNLYYIKFYSMLIHSKTEFQQMIIFYFPNRYQINTDKNTFFWYNFRLLLLFIFQINIWNLFPSRWNFLDFFISLYSSYFSTMIMISIKLTINWHYIRNSNNKMKQALNNNQFNTLQKLLYTFESHSWVYYLIILNSIHYPFIPWQYILEKDE